MATSYNMLNDLDCELGKLWAARTLSVFAFRLDHLGKSLEPGQGFSP